jgi:hypothetical protein
MGIIQELVLAICILAVSLVVSGVLVGVLVWVMYRTLMFLGM